MRWRCHKCEDLRVRREQCQCLPAPSTHNLESSSQLQYVKQMIPESPEKKRKRKSDSICDKFTKYAGPPPGRQVHSSSLVILLVFFPLPVIRLLCPDCLIRRGKSLPQRLEVPSSRPLLPSPGEGGGGRFRSSCAPLTGDAGVPMLGLG